MPTPEEIQKARDEFAAAAAAPVKATSFEPTALPQVSAEEIQKARDEFAAALQPKPAAEVITKGPVTSPEPGLQVIAKPTEPPVVVPDEYAPKPKEEAVPAETPQAPLIPEAIPPEEEQRRVPIEAAGGGGGGGGGGFGAPPEEPQGPSVTKDFFDVWNHSTRGGASGAIDVVTGVLGKVLGGAAGTMEKTEFPMPGDEESSSLLSTPEGRAQAQTTATELLRGAVRLPTGYMYKPPEAPAGTTIDYGSKNLNAVLPTNLQQVGDLFSTLAVLGPFIEAGGWAVGKLFPMVGKNPANLMEGISTAGAIAKRVGATGLGFFGLEALRQSGELVADNAQMTPENLLSIPGKGAQGALFGMALHYLGELAVPYIAKMFDWVGQKRATALFSKQDQLMRDSLTKAYWEDQVAEAGGLGKGAPSDAALHDWWKSKTPDEQQFIAVNSDVWKEFKKAFPDLVKAPVTPGAEVPPTAAPKGPPPPEESVNLKPTPMGTGADEVTVAAAEAPVTPAPKAAPTAEVKPTPVGTGADEVAAVAKVPLVAEAAPTPTAEAKPTPIETIGTGDAVIKSDQVAADTQAAKTAAEAKAAPAVTPAPTEIAPETMAQASAPANVEPAKGMPEVYNEKPDKTGYWRVEGSDVTHSTEAAATKAAERIAALSPGRDTFTQTQPPVLEQTENGVQERPLVQHSLKQARQLAPVYYSQMSKFMDDKLPGKGTGEDLSKLIEGWAGLKEVGRNKNDVPIFSKAEFKQDELKWSGLLPWLREQKGVVTKQEVVQFLKDNPTEVEVSTRGASLAKTTAKVALDKARADYHTSFHAAVAILEGKDVDTNRARYIIAGVAKGEATKSSYPTELRHIPDSMATDLISTHVIMKDAELKHDQLGTGSESPVKYEQYSMEGPKEQYRETLSTLPGLKSADYYKWQGMISELRAKYGESFYTMATKIERAQLENLHRQAGYGAGAVFKGAHWTEPNVVVHTRGANRVDADGKKAYVLEENQGDWHQQGRKEGYAASPEEIKALRVEAGKISKEIESTVDQMTATKQERRDLGEVAEGKAGPKTPVTHKWAKRDIQISYNHDGGDFLSIPAQVLGNFAIHRLVTNSMKPGRYWRVTHVGTGLIASGPGVDFSSINATQAQARKFAEYLVEHGKANWDFTDVQDFRGENQALGKEDLQRAAVASGLVHPNTLELSTEPAPVRPGWSKEHKLKAHELEKKLESLKDQISDLSEQSSALSGQIHRAEKGVANAPFSKTWPELGMKRALREAAEDPTIERLEWTAGEVQFERWGSERIDWKKIPGGLTMAEEEEYNRLSTMNKHHPLEGNQATQLASYKARKLEADLAQVEGKPSPARWTVAAKEQHGGFAGGVDIEQTARDRGKLLEERGKKISTKAELDRIVKQTLSRERNNEEMNKLTDRLWERMQTEEEGTSLPRKEGMEAFYDKMLPTFMGKYVKQWGGTVGKTAVSGEAKPSWSVERINDTGIFNIRGPRGIVTNHDLREAGIDAPNNFSAAAFDNAGAIKMAKRLFGDYNQNIKTYPVWYVDITPEMRESVLYNGQPQFRLKEAENVQKETGPANRAVQGQNRWYDRGHLPQNGEGAQRELEAFQTLYRGEPNTGRTANWSTLRYADDLAVEPGFQAVVASAHAEGIDLVIPVRGASFNAQIITDRGKTTMLIDADHDLDKTTQQLGDHEIGHHKLNRGDEDMLRLIARVDTESTAFKLYRESIDASADAVGQKRLSKAEMVQEIACDYRAGIHVVEVDGARVNFTSAFRPEGQAAPGFMRTLFGRPAAAAASPRAPPPGGKSIIPGVRSRLKKAPKAPEDVLIDKYKLAKVANVGGKNWAKEQARRLEVKHMDMIREAVGEKKVGPKTIEMSKVLTNFIDHFREPEHLAKFYHDQPAEVQGWLDKFAQVSDDPDLMTIVGKLKGASEALATEAYDEEVIREAFENHQNRIYKEEKRPGHMAGAKFATATGHSKKRFYMTRLEARAPVEKGGGGKTFKVENVAENLRVLTEEIKNVIENRRMVARGLKEEWLSTDQHEGWRPAPWPQMYKRTWQFKAEPEAIILEMQRLSTEVKNSSTTSTSTKGGPAPGAGATGGSESGPVQKMIDVITNSLEVRGVTPEEAKTYVRRVQEAAVRAAKGAPETPPPEGTPAPETITTIIKEVRETLTTLEKQQKVVGHRFDEIRRKNMYMDNDGNVFAKVPLYAPPEVAKDLHRLFETQELSPTMEKVVQYNAMAKASTLAFSGFHLFSYGRNLLTIPGFWQAVHPIGYYKKGRALAEAEHPDTEGLIRNGYITFSGKPPDWSELAEDQRTALGDLMGKNALTRKTRDAFWNLIDFNAKLIFEKVGNSYKLQFAHDILNHLRNKYPHLTDEQAYYYAADHANDVFGGRNEEIAGTLFGDRLASSAKARLWSRLFILARDWTMSNLRLFMKAFQRGPSGHLARQYWGYAMAKTFAAVIAINLLVSMIDDRSAWQSFKDAFHDPKQLRWLDVNVTPFYKLAATLAGYTPTEARKYLRVGGHFYDAFKMIINPVQFFHHKQSVLARFFWEGLSGQDWRGNVFTTLNELTGITESVMGPLTGQLTKEGKSTGAIGYAQAPSFLLHQVRGIVPIPMQNMLYAMMGEMDGFTAAIKSAGGLASSANVKTEAQDLMTEYYQNVTPTTKSPGQKERTELKKELLQVYRSGDLDTFKDRLEEAVTNKVVSHQEAQQWADEAPLPPGVQSFVKLPMEMAMKVMAAGTEEEKNLWMPYLLRKIGQSKPDTILKHQEALVKLLDKEGAGDTASVIEALNDPAAAKQLKFTAPDIAEMHRIDMLESWGVVDTYVASLLRQQMAPKPPPRPTLSANPLRGGLGKQRSVLDKMLGIRS